MVAFGHPRLVRWDSEDPRPSRGSHWLGAFGGLPWAIAKSLETVGHHYYNNLLPLACLSSLIFLRVHVGSSISLVSSYASSLYSRALPCLDGLGFQQA